ncbi:MAG: hypothetical protein ACI936_001850 [Paraglaciecola sp.]|jgi:hypothetical protein
MILERVKNALNNNQNVTNYIARNKLLINEIHVYVHLNQSRITRGMLKL